MTKAIDPTEGPPGDAPGAPETPTPVIIVQTRRSWVATASPPLLILVAAAAILSHRVKIEDWQGLASVFGKAPASAPTVAASPSAPPPPAPEPATEAPAAAPSPPIVVKVIAKAPPPPRPELPSRFAPPAFTPRPLAINVQAEARATSARIWDDIRRKADDARQEAQAMQALKERVVVEDDLALAERQEAARRRAEARGDDRRTAFRKSLKTALATPAGQSAAKIRTLCASRGVRFDDAPPGPTPTRSPMLTSAGRRERVEKFRQRGMEEAAILKDLATLEYRNHAARSGPRSPDEALVRAARQLLDVPLADDPPR